MLQNIDWMIIGVYMLATLILGLLVGRSSGKDLTEYFLGGRHLPWWVAGASLIATSFACDTPVWVASVVRQWGVQEAWRYWATMLGAGIAVFVFSRLWRRLNILTELELIELRYDGKGAALLRGIHSIYGSFFFPVLVISWVTKAMQKILEATIGLDSTISGGWFIGIAIAVAIIYSASSGLRGVVYTDLVMLIISTLGTLVLAILSVRAVGGLDVLFEKLETHTWQSGAQGFSMLPDLKGASMSFWNLVGYGLLLWWPLAVSNSYASQRIMACKTENSAAKMNLMYNVIIWGVNAWPWILVALCSLFLIPQAVIESHGHEIAYPWMIMNILPAGLRGGLLVAMIAAFMSTISTLINYGSSLFVNDCYKRFIQPDCPQERYVWIGRVISVIIPVAGGFIAYKAPNIDILLQVGFQVTIPLSMLIFLRFFWSRLTIAGEITGFFAAVALTFVNVAGAGSDGAPGWLDPFVRALFNDPNALYHTDYDLLGLRILFTVLGCLLVTVLVSFATPMPREDTLVAFIKRAKPFRFFWRGLIEKHGIPYEARQDMGTFLAGWLAVTVAILSVILSIGFYCWMKPVLGTLFLILAVAGIVFSVKLINHVAPEQDEESVDTPVENQTV